MTLTTFDLVIKKSILCKILTGSVAALTVLLFMEFHYFEEIPTQWPFNPRNNTTKTKSYLSKPQPSHVLLNAYHRSGSTYAGRLLSLHNDTFYWFEPLQKTLGQRFYNKNGSMCDGLFPRCEDLEDQDSMSLNRSLEFLIDLYSCNIDKHFNRFNDALTKSHYFQVNAAYKRCRLSGVQPNECYLAYAKSCVKAKNIVTKLVRLDIHHTEVLLQKYPKLKVLQLMRDPRGIINCRLSHTTWYPISEQPDARERIEDNVKILCSRMRSDMEGARKLARQFPNRVRIIQYEDIVKAQEKRDALYKYIGAAILKRKIHVPYLAVKIQTSGPYSFRDQLSQSSLDIVQEHCSDIIEMLGLRVFNSYDEMKNMSIQVEMRKTFPFAI